MIVLNLTTTSSNSNKEDEISKKEGRVNGGFLSDTEPSTTIGNQQQKQLLKRIETGGSSNPSMMPSIGGSNGGGGGGGVSSKKNEDLLPNFEKNIPKQVTLAWKGLSIRAEIRTLTQRVIATVKRQKRRYETILQNVRGIVEPGEMLALMGPRLDFQRFRKVKDLEKKIKSRCLKVSINNKKICSFVLFL